MLLQRATRTSTHHPIDVTYLDHAGTTLYSRSLIESFSTEMLNSLVGNPHSASSSAMSMAYRVDYVRTRVLKLFKADAVHFDVIFVANATAAIKLVADAFHGHCNSFSYAYHKDSHTSVVGVRELAKGGSCCLQSDDGVDNWLENVSKVKGSRKSPLLFAYPGQSNMNGRRLPLHWPGRLRRARPGQAFTLLDAAGLVSTSPLDLSDVDNAPDFISMSFYKIFGFPDLGALIVRKDAGHIFDHRRYFGGGTVEMVTCLGDQWHQKKKASLHAGHEDGTLPLRSIIALGCAIEAHDKLYGGLEEVSKHTSWLAKDLYERMASLRHSNGMPVCKIFKDNTSTYGDARTQGATVTFNFRNAKGGWVSNHEVNRLASAERFHIRAGTLCNPGGMAKALDINPNELKRYFAEGFRCGSGNDVREGKSVGMCRVSLGACSTTGDIDQWMDFVKRNFVQSAFSTKGAALDIFIISSPPVGQNFQSVSLEKRQLKKKSSWMELKHFLARVKVGM